MNRFGYLTITLLFISLPTFFFAQSPNSWRSLGPFTEWPYPFNRHEHATIELEGKFYVIGGRGNKPVQIYYPETNTWENGAEPPIEIHHSQLVGLDGLIYVLGAFTGDFPHETPLSRVYIYDTQNDQWIDGPWIPEDRRRGAAAAVVYNDKIYIVCGLKDGHSSGWVNYLDVFDPVSESWTSLADAPRARDHFHAAIVGSKIYVAGGRRSGEDGTFNATVGEVDMYDIGTNTWTTLAQQIPTKRAGCSAAVIGNDVLIIGGESGTQMEAHPEVEALNTMTGNWRTLAPMNQGRHGMQAFGYKGEIYVLAGSIERGANEIKPDEVNFMEVYTPELRTNILDKKDTEIQIFPNPIVSGGQLKLKWSPSDSNFASVSLSLVNVLGQELFKGKLASEALRTGVMIDLPQQLIPGIYILVLERGQGVWKKKLLIE